MNYYEILGISINATQSDITKAFRKLAKIHHPDKGGTSENFQNINKAYEILTNPVQKEIYDGMFKVKQYANLNVSLQDLYTGVVKTLPIITDMACELCLGKGGTDITLCNICHGNTFITQRIGLNILNRIHIPCVCNQGYIVKNKCKKCNGLRIFKQTHTLDIKINKGMKDGDKLILNNLIITLKCDKHNIFNRKGNDLYFKRKITLFSALTGCQFVFEHLDNHKILITSNGVIKHNDVKCIKNKGMPALSGGFGDLYITFDIIYPDKLITDKILLSKIINQNVQDVVCVDIPEHILE